jgi:hypothetical protein
MPTELQILVVIFGNVHNEDKMHVLFEVHYIFKRLLRQEFLDGFIKAHSPVFTINADQSVVVDTLKSCVIGRVQSLRELLN